MLLHSLQAPQTDTASRRISSTEPRGQSRLRWVGPGGAFSTKGRSQSGKSDTSDTSDTSAGAAGAVPGAGATSAGRPSAPPRASGAAGPRASGPLGVPAARCLERGLVSGAPALDCPSSQASQSMS